MLSIISKKLIPQTNNTQQQLSFILFYKRENNVDRMNECPENFLKTFIGVKVFKNFKLLHL